MILADRVQTQRSRDKRIDQRGVPPILSQIRQNKFLAVVNLSWYSKNRFLVSVFIFYFLFFFL